MFRKLHINNRFDWVASRTYVVDEDGNKLYSVRGGYAGASLECEAYIKGYERAMRDVKALDKPAES
jgi:hypothetical protein